MPVRGPFRLTSDEQARSFNLYGFFVLENAIDSVTVEQLRDLGDSHAVGPIGAFFLREAPWISLVLDSFECAG